MRKTASAIFSAVLLAGCDSGPTLPGSLPPGGYAVRISTTIPGELTPGSELQLAASLHFTDGRTEDISNEVRWGSSDPELLSVSPTGLLRAARAGEGKVTASHSGLTEATNVLILATGTLKISGRVTELGTRVGLRGAQVHSTDPTGLQLVTSTIDGGTYALYGVAPGAELRVAMDAYETHVQRLGHSGHTSVDIALRLLRSRPDISGTYTLTIAAAPECEGVLPPDAMTRRYTAVVQQQGPAVSATLEDAIFFSTRSHDTARRYIFGGFEGDRPTFTMGGFTEDTYADIIEQLPASLFFVPAGRVVGTIAETGVSGALDGTLSVRKLVTAEGGFGPVAECRSAAHRFTLER